MQDHLDGHFYEMYLEVYYVLHETARVGRKLVVGKFEVPDPDHNLGRTTA